MRDSFVAEEIAMQGLELRKTLLRGAVKNQRLSILVQLPLVWPISQGIRLPLMSFSVAEG